MQIKKKKVIEKLLSKVKEEIAHIEAALGSSRSHATDHDLMKSEGKYDTRAIEAGYLADGHQKRLNELEQELHLLESIEVREFGKDDEVAIGALVAITLNQNEKLYFISPTAGGTLLDIDGTPILVISVFSPLGSEALGLMAGDSFEIETPKENREYKIKEVF